MCPVTIYKTKKYKIIVHSYIIYVFCIILKMALVYLLKSTNKENLLVLKFLLGIQNYSLYLLLRRIL